MLVLTQRPGEEVTVTIGGEKLTIKLLEVRGEKARVGYSGSESFEVLRANAICRQRRRREPVKLPA